MRNNKNLNTDDNHSNDNDDDDKNSSSNSKNDYNQSSGNNDDDNGTDNKRQQLRRGKDNAGYIIIHPFYQLSLLSSRLLHEYPEGRGRGVSHTHIPLKCPLTVLRVYRLGPFNREREREREGRAEVCQ